jgi:hypothetical protein
MHACWVAPLRREEFSAHWREFEIRIYTVSSCYGVAPLTFCAQATLFAGALCALDEWRCEDNADDSGTDRDDLAPARGIAVSVLIAFALWLAIVATVLPDRTARSTWRGSASKWSELSLRPFDQRLPAAE